MARLEDYHRTVVGYHGTTLGVALKLVNRISEFTASTRDYDWLGRGVYFWEYAPRQALTFAEIPPEAASGETEQNRGRGAAR